MDMIIAETSDPNLYDELCSLAERLKEDSCPFNGDCHYLNAHRVCGLCKSLHLPFTEVCAVKVSLCDEHLVYDSRTYYVKGLHEVVEWLNRHRSKFNVARSVHKLSTPLPEPSRPPCVIVATAGTEVSLKYIPDKEYFCRFVRYFFPKASDDDIVSAITGAGCQDHLLYLFVRIFTWPSVGEAPRQAPLRR